MLLRVCLADISYCSTKIERRIFFFIVVTLCLDAGLSIDAQTIAGNTPLHYACMWGALDTLAILIDRGAAMNITNNADKSALDVMLSINDAARAKVAAVYNEVR